MWQSSKIIKEQQILACPLWRLPRFISHWTASTSINLSSTKKQIQNIKYTKRLLPTDCKASSESIILLTSHFSPKNSQIQNGGFIFCSDKTAITQMFKQIYNYELPLFPQRFSGDTKMLGISIDLSCNVPKPLKKLMEKENENLLLFIHTFYAHLIRKPVVGRGSGQKNWEIKAPQALS